VKIDLEIKFPGRGLGKPVRISLMLLGCSGAVGIRTASFLVSRGSRTVSRRTLSKQSQDEDFPVRETTIRRVMKRESTM